MLIRAAGTQTEGVRGKSFPPAGSGAAPRPPEAAPFTVGVWGAAKRLIMRIAGRTFTKGNRSGAGASRREEGG
jgi:hypothetical protein